MPENTLEECIKRLEEINEQQNRKIERLEGINEIANMMGRYAYLHEVQKDPEFYDTMFSKKRPDISYEVANAGVYKGQEGVKRALDAHGPMGDADKPMPGTLFIHTLTSPVIEIAEDGQNAKGVWTSPGVEAVIDPATGERRGFWCWSKYGCDFVKEDGHWKIWHYHVYRIFLTPADTDFCDEYELKVMDPAKASGNFGPPGTDMPKIPPRIPDGPATYDNPYCKDYIPELIPAPPVPYKTFDPATSYGPPEE